MKSPLKKYLIAFLIPFFFVVPAKAQYQKSNWWAFSYSFMQMKTSQGVASEVGHIPMLNLELGVAFTPSFAMSVSGGYGTDSMNFSGTNLIGGTTNQLLPVSLLQARVDGLLMYQSFYFNLGYGYRDFHDDINGTYSRDLRTEFLPLGIYYVRQPFYFHAEYRRYISGDENVQNFGGGRQDVNLSQGGGNCYALEAGWVINRPLGIKVSLQYAVWNLDGSDSQSDGLETITEPSMTTKEITLALGLLF
jgi:hypothetical protein